MKKIILGIAVLVLVVGLIILKPTEKGMVNATQKVNDKQQVQEMNTVLIKDFSYGPAKLTVKKGTKVTWVNMDDAHHDVTPISGSADFIASKLLSKGEKYEFIFETVGVYTYKCSPHPYMKGSIEVIE